MRDTTSSKPTKNDEPEAQLDSGRRDFVKGVGAAAGVAVGVAAAAQTGKAHADTVRETADRYVPPGQFWHHFDVEWWEFPKRDPKKPEVWGYTDKLSYLPGETVSFHVSTSAPTFDVRVYRDGLNPQEAHSTQGIAGRWSETPKDAYSVGCGWPALYQWTLPSDLKSGFYVVVFSIKRGDEIVEQAAGFAVRSARPTSPIVFMLATMTWVAYNDWAGGSYYGKPGGGGITGDELGIVPRLHLQRPWARGFMRMPLDAPRINDRRNRNRPIGGRASYPNFEWCMANGYAKYAMAAGWGAYDRYMAIWAEKNGYELDYITQHDLAANPDLLNGYKCLMTTGHDEYYTWGMRDSMDRFMEAGGGFARFGGNTVWQVRMEDDGLVQVCYKNFAVNHDPQKNERTRTDAWEHPTVGRPAATTFACSTSFGHLAGTGAAAPRSPGFTVYQPDHWMLEGSDLYYGDAFGSVAAGYECDGLPVTMRDGLIYPTDEFGTPTNIEIAALLIARQGEEDHGHTPRLFAGPAYLQGMAEGLHGTTTPTDAQIEKHTRGNGVLAYMPKGKGGVATGATTDWCYALDKDPFVAKITDNVLKRFSN